MPGMDRTGPLGNGPIGRGRGPCRGGSGSQQGNGAGVGRGFRRGGGFGRWFSPEIPQEDEKTILEQRSKWLQTQIESVSKRLEELNSSEL